MKTRIFRKTGLILVATASLSISSFASGDINISALKESSKAIVKIEVPAQDDVNVSLRDPDGIVVHSDVISKNSEYGRVFDFSQVNDGVYTFVTKTGYTTTTKTIELKNNSISILGKDYSYDPIFMIDGDLLIVSYLNQSTEDISISLEDSKREYFKEKEGNSLTYGKMINIEKLSSGEYTLALVVGDKEYKYRFSR